MNLLLKSISPANANRSLRIIYIIFGICAIYLIFFTKYHTFLPFLDRTVLPPSILLLSEQADTNTQVTINARDAIKVVYWAAHADNQIIEDSPYDAYESYENVGIAAVINHKAILKLKCPASYKVGIPFKKTVPKHVHYRLIYSNGVLSEIHTLKLGKECNNNNKTLSPTPNPTLTPNPTRNPTPNPTPNPTLNPTLTPNPTPTPTYSDDEEY